MQAYLARLFLGLPVAATLMFVPRGASADDNDPTAIEQRLKALEATPEKQAVTRDPVANARKAIKRVLDARSAGDAVHAIELAALAADWAKLAANVLRAVEIEQELLKLQDQLTLVEQKRRRTEILIEATVAQRERTKEELERAKAEKAQKQPRDSASSTKTNERSLSKGSTPVQASKTVPAAVPPATNQKATVKP